MARFSCFPNLLAGAKKKSKEPSIDADHMKEKENSFCPSAYRQVSKNDVDVLSEKIQSLNKDNFVPNEKYEGEEEHDHEDDSASMRRDFSDFDLQPRDASSVGSHSQYFGGYDCGVGSVDINIKLERDESVTPEWIFPQGHICDPDMLRKTEDIQHCHELERSCSNIETRSANAALHSPPGKSFSYGDLKRLVVDFEKKTPVDFHRSPLSVRTTLSVDRAVLSKRSLSQVLPSSSRKLWWKMFTWSHRDLHRAVSFNERAMLAVTDASRNKGGYDSDMMAASEVIDVRNEKAADGSTNPWIAMYTAESSLLGRVNAWMNSIEESSFCQNENENNMYSGESSGLNNVCPESGELLGRKTCGARRNDGGDDLRVNSVLQSLDASSSAVHLSGMGFKVMPNISVYHNLRTVNVSNNFIDQISTGSLPKSLHALDLSRNRITTTEGLRELTRLRVLNLSGNRISRIGHGLSNCGAIRELYLAGNKISDVDGLHRLLKLAVLDVSFNKISTTNGIGQLVANYNSLLVLNLLGNPIQSNVGSDHLRKAVTSLLPKLMYLNKQPIKQRNVREVATTNNVAKAALGNKELRSRRRWPVRQQLSQSSGSTHVSLNAATSRKNTLRTSQRRGK